MIFSERLLLKTFPSSVLLQQQRTNKQCTGGEKHFEPASVLEIAIMSRTQIKPSHPNCFSRMSDRLQKEIQGVEHAYIKWILMDSCSAKSST